MKDQIDASSGSIMENIAEGFGSGGNLEFINFYLFQSVQAMNAKANCIGFWIKR